MSFRKKDAICRRKRGKQRKSIEKLFDKLRDQSSSNEENLDGSVLIINDSPICSTGAATVAHKKNRIRQTNSLTDLIVIHENMSSTPLPNKKSVRNKINISNISSCSGNLLRNLDRARELNSDINNLTKEINRDSFLTIDLTTESVSKQNDTVIDLADETNQSDCTIVSENVSIDNSSMSGDSEVTVINTKRNKRKMKNNMFQFAEGIAKMNASQKGKLLELITNNIFGGCKMSDQAISQIKVPENRATDTVEDVYIKEVILGQTPSRNSIGSNIYNPQKDIKNKTGLRLVVIDGSNVAMEHTKGREFSVKALQICIDYFLKRGHVVKAFVPRFRCKFGKSSDPRLLESLERQGLVVYTPSREVQGRNIVSYDDRYIVQCAAEFDGVIVSGDNYRDLMCENPRWRSVIENRLLQFTWVNDMIMFPRDPMGRNGPSLEYFLKHH